MLQCKILTTETEIQAIAGEWRDLHARAAHSAFSDYDLVQTWWSTIGKNFGVQTLHIVAVREDGRLVAVLPLTVARKRGIRVLQAAGFKGYNYCDMLAESPAHAEAAWKAARKSSHYDFADIRDVYPQSMSYQVLQSFAQRRDLTETLYLRFDWKNSKDWLASLSTRVNREYRRHMRRLQEKGPVRFNVCTNEAPPKSVIDEMIRLKRDWCIAHNEGGLFVQPGVNDYFYRLVSTAAAQNRLCFSWLQCGDEAIAFMLCLRFQNVLQGYVITYNPVWGHCSPGITLLMDVISWGIDNGCQGLDLRQGAGDYKTRFTNVVSHCAEFTFSGSSNGQLITTASMAARRLWRMVRGGKIGAAAIKTGKVAPRVYRNRVFYKLLTFLCSGITSD